MSITLAEYRELKEGRATLAEIEARHGQPPPDVPEEAPAASWAGNLPYPPSLNRYYRHVGAKVLISRHGREYRKAVERMLDGCRRIGGRVRMRVDVYPPDLRRRDLDNLLKGLQDALVHGGLLADDSDIKELHMEMHEPKRPSGMVRVEVRGLDF